MTKASNWDNIEWRESKVKKIQQKIVKATEQNNLKNVTIREGKFEKAGKR